MRTSHYTPVLAAEWAIPERTENHDEPCGDRPPLVELPPGPWRSLGGYLDYTDWPERERFMELDLAIKSRQDGLLPLHAKDRICPSRRCRASIPDRGNCNAIVTRSENYDGWKCEAHRKLARRAHRAVSPAVLQTPGDQAGRGRVDKAEPGALENLRRALLDCGAFLAQAGA